MNKNSYSSGIHRSASQPLIVSKDCWMIGYRNPASLLQCNTYLRIFSGPRQGIGFCIDPGSQFDAAVVEANLNALTGDEGPEYITVNHQDPDVTGNLPALCRANPAATVLLTEDTWRLVQHLSVQPGKLQFPPALGSRRQILPHGIAWQPVPTPFCHFRGAMAWYDLESRTLFSGDLFGGLNQVGRVHLFAEEADWSGIAQFHQIYMPSREIVRYTLHQIRAITPAVETIAPQHGHVITGDLVPLFLERMEQLLVGHDLLALELDARYTREYTELIGLMLDYATEVMGRDDLEARLSASDVDDDLEQSLSHTAGKWEVQQAPYACSAKVFRRLARGEEATFVDEMRSRVLRHCSDRAVPVPLIGWGLETRQAGS